VISFDTIGEPLLRITSRLVDGKGATPSAVEGTADSKQNERIENFLFILILDVLARW
jgi:hypothetical protein